MKGYAHHRYIESLAEFGEPRELPECGGYVLERAIPGSSCRDAMGAYPLFSCRDWARLGSDLEGLKGHLVSLSMVADPFGNYDVEVLERCFDLVVPYKEHFVADLKVPTDKMVSKHHRYSSRKSLEEVRVEKCENPALFLEEWTGLYGHLTERHGLQGIQAFSRSSFARQLSVPGITAFRAVHRGVTIGMDLWYEQGGVAYRHLAATAPVGYEVGAAYALLWEAIGFFADRARWLHLGAGAGVDSRSDDGLTRFKRGWATGTRTAYFCGRVLDPARYAALSAGHPASTFFPRYRQGEFG